MYVSEELEKNADVKLNGEQSNQLITKISRQWFKLDETVKQAYEERLKNTKKALKKAIKNFVKVNRKNLN